jgi:SAM-dependent methyltransferase
MLGTLDIFRYGECADCGSLTLIDPPPDATQYYRRDSYYAFARPGAATISRVEYYLRKLRTDAFLRLRLAPTRGPAFLKWFQGHGITRYAYICDLGCGDGGLLRYLAQQGFRHLVGIDPYLPDAVDSVDRVILRRGFAADTPNGSDVIMLHHSLEHMDRPRETLALLAERLAPRGIILIRVPLVDSVAWREFGASWVQIDAPRHLWIPSSDAISRLAVGAGLRVTSSWRDSTAFQFIGSYRYQDGVPFPNVKGSRSEAAAQRRLHERAASSQARRLNLMGLGDQGCFVLRASPAAPHLAHHFDYR